MLLPRSLLEHAWFARRALAVRLVCSMQRARVVGRPTSAAISASKSMGWLLTVAGWVAAGSNRQLKGCATRLIRLSCNLEVA